MNPVVAVHCHGPSPATCASKLRFVWTLLLLFLTQMLPVSAQHWSDGMLPNGDWSEAHQSFKNTWLDSVPEKGKGFKPFQRWWHFAHKRWAYEGAKNTFTPDILWQQTASEREGRHLRVTPLDPMWSPATPLGLPKVGAAGRTSRVVIDPQDTSHWMLCAPSGGLWQSVNSGESWTTLGVADWAGMGASDLAMDPQDPNHILVATGDADFGSAYGIGVLETFDAGLSWNTTGLNFEVSATHTVSRVHFQPGAPNAVLAGTSNGVWKSEDAGQTFYATLDGLCSDLLPHPNAPHIWHAALRPGAIHRSTDGGQTWTIAAGLPDPIQVSRITLSTSESAPNQVWAIAAKSSTQGLEGVYLSVDTGLTYQKLENVPNLLGWTSTGADLGGQGFYDLALAVDPNNPSHIIAGGVNLWSSQNAGLNWTCLGHWYGADSIPEVHADHHAVTFIPGSSDALSAHDGGVARIHNSQIEDRSNGLVIGQVYHIGLSEIDRDRILSGWQDNGVNLQDAEQHARVLGADGFHCMVSPQHPDTLYAAEYFGKTFRSTDGGWSWSDWIQGNASGVHERGDWDTPMAFSPANPELIFVAKRRVYWTLDHGQTWNQTPALPGSEIEVMALSATNDSCVIVAKGSMAYRTEGLTTWTPLFNLPDLPIADIVIDNERDSTFWIGFGGYNAAQRIWVTHDAGLSWNEEGSGLPALPVNTLIRDTLTTDLYAGTDAGVYILPAGTNNWTPYKAGLPEVLCTDLVLRYSTSEVLLATYGRGIWRAPMYTPPTRDGALLAIRGASSEVCGAAPNVRLNLRNAGADTLVSATILWNGIDTLEYGFVLPPNDNVWLPWPGVTPTQLEWNAALQARLLDIVSLNGGLANGNLTPGPDAVSENDIVHTQWRHATQSGPVVFHTTADCFPLQSAWLLLDSTGTETHKRQHFTPESVTTDTLCMSHGCHTLVLHDEGGDGLSGSPCGMEGDLEIESATGGVIWRLSDPELPDVNFGMGDAHTLCFPIEGTFGCNDPAACNFNPIAQDHDGSCIYDCANPNCPGDFNHDGLLGANDILAVLSEYGCNTDCSKDITGDGAVTANDILAVLALYGSMCSE